MEDEYKVVYTLSNCANFDDLDWHRTPVSRSQYSLNANISQTVHPVHSMSGSRQGFSGRRIEWCYFRFDNIQDGGWRPSWNNGAVARNSCVSWAFLFFVWRQSSLRWDLQVGWGKQKLPRSYISHILPEALPIWGRSYCWSNRCNCLRKIWFLGKLENHRTLNESPYIRCSLLPCEKNTN